MFRKIKQLCMRYSIAIMRKEKISVLQMKVNLNYFCFDFKGRIVYYVPRRAMRVIARRATMLAGDRSRGAISPASIVARVS